MASRGFSERKKNIRYPRGLVTGPKNVLDELEANGPPFLRKIVAGIDKKLIRRTVKLTKRLIRALSVASPKSSKDLISAIAIDLADLWEIGEQHQRRLRELFDMRFPKDKTRLENMLYDFDIHLILHSEWHLRSLKKRLKELRRDLHRK